MLRSDERPPGAPRGRGCELTKEAVEEDLTCARRALGLIYIPQLIVCRLGSMERCVLLTRLGLANMQSYDFQMPYYREPPGL